MHKLVKWNLNLVIKYLWDMHVEASGEQTYSSIINNLCVPPTRLPTSITPVKEKSALYQVSNNEEILEQFCDEDELLNIR